MEHETFKYPDTDDNIEGGKIRMAYQGNLLSKTLFIGIIILFIGMSFTPSVAVDNVKESSMPTSYGNTLYVGGSGEGNYTKIEDAIENASDGDTVYVYNGTYKDRVVVDKSIKLVGENKNTTIIDGCKRDGNVVTIYYADWVTVSGFTIRNSEYQYFGIKLYCSNNCTIIGNIISNNWQGIFISRSSNNIIKNNTISKNLAIIWLWENSFDNTIIKNNFILNLGIPSVFFRLECYNKFLFSNKWNQNYWGRPRILPKLIFGTLSIRQIKITLPWFYIDWHPTKEPYDIGV